MQSYYDPQEIASVFRRWSTIEHVVVYQENKLVGNSLRELLAIDVWFVILAARKGERIPAPILVPDGTLIPSKDGFFVYKPD